ncbi:MAG TPA: TIGR02206 family membrane protein [Bryobacteraceae bacterium]|nr:TIGR02206 family membrane protein [Bryobacteraceae bacterium]
MAPLEVCAHAPVINKVVNRISLKRCGFSWPCLSSFTKGWPPTRRSYSAEVNLLLCAEPSDRIGTVRFFGPVHLTLLIGIAAVSIALSALCRRRRISGRAVRLAVGYGIGLNELIWWVFRYSHEGLRVTNLPLQLCDVAVWGTVIACLTLKPAAVEFAYFVGLAGAGMALLTPDLWSPWPSYPAIYFFVAHGGIVTGCSALVFGRIARLRPNAVWRAFGLLLAYAALIAVFDAVFGTNYVYLCRKPRNASLLDALGPWPLYLVTGAAVGLALFWLLWLPVRRLAHTPLPDRP